MTVKRVAILGAGNGGITAAADLKSRGFEVALFELPRFGKNLEQIKNIGKIRFITPEGEESIMPDLLTTNIREAVKGAQMVMLTIPANGLEEFADICLPVLEDDQIILIHNAACMGPLRFVNRAKKAGLHRKFRIGELNTLAYGTRAFPEKAEVELSLRVKHLYFSAYPAKNTSELIGPCRELYDSIVSAANIWETTLANGNPEVHTGTSLLNAGRIEYSQGEFWLYKEGITPHTVNIIKQVCSERLALGKALGIRLDDEKEARFKRGYLIEGPENLEVLFNTSPVFSKIKGPSSVNSRYITEDISNGLVLYSNLGKALNVPTPASDAIITLGGFLLQRDFRKEGITLEKLGLDKLDAEGLIAAVS
jgi:opine dehydrogenase